MMNASPGWIKFKRAELVRARWNFGDGDVATGNTNEEADGVPTADERTYTGGTLIVEQEDSHSHIRHHGTSLVEVHYCGCDFRGLLDSEVSSVSCY